MQSNSSYQAEGAGGGSDSDDQPGNGKARMARAMQTVERLVEENAVVVFSQSGCCMCHVVKRLFCNLGVGPTIYELDEHVDGADLEKAMLRLQQEAGSKTNGGGSSSRSPVPTVFVGGKLLGGLDAVMAAHLSGELVPRLKQAGALWL